MITRKASVSILTKIAVEDTDGKRKKRRDLEGQGQTSKRSTFFLWEIEQRNR